MMLRLIFFTMVLSFQMAIAQTTEFDIILFGNVIGAGFSTKTTLADGSVQLQINSNATAKVFFKEHTYSSDIIANYKNDILQHCVLNIEKDGEWERQSVELIDGSHIHTFNDKRQAATKDVVFTSTQLFFEEPVNQPEIYIERINQFIEIENLGDHLYRTKVEGGGQNFYQYENGELIEFRVKKTVNIYMTKK